METTDIEVIIASKNVFLKGYGAKYPLKLLSRPPCSAACPAGVNAKAYVNLTARKRYEEALHLVLKSNPFPGICGRACTRPCEKDCTGDGEFSPLHIRELKRFIADVEMSRRGVAPGSSEVLYDERIAVVGSGPAGLTAASDLSKMGYPVTVFEKETRAGGMLIQCIPRYRLPGEIVDFEVRSIVDSGVSLVTGRDIPNAGVLFHEGFSAVLLAVGATRDRVSGIPGKDKEGVVECLPFLRRSNSGEVVDIGGRVLVIGGGNSAVDAARTAVRHGADSVTIAYRRSEKEMPADGEEIEQAREEGINIVTLAMPKEIVGSSAVEGVVFLRCELGEMGSDGRRTFIPVENSEFTIPADMVIPAIGNMPDIEGFAGEVDISKWGTIEVDDSGRAGKKIFAAGDVVTGPSTIVEAIGAGHAVAGEIHYVLSGNSPAAKNIPMMIGIATGYDDGRIRSWPESDRICARRDDDGTKAAHDADGTASGHEGETGRSILECLPPQDRVKGFCEVSRGFSEYEAVEEARRCKSCGSCFECVVCLNYCKWGQLYGSVESSKFIVKAPHSLREKVHKGRNDWNIIIEDNEEGQQGRQRLEGNEKGRKERIRLESLIPRVNDELCVGCGSCESACPYSAVQVRMRRNEPNLAVVDGEACRNCGICVSACPSGAMTQGPLSPHDKGRKIRELMEKNPGSPVVLASYWDIGATSMDDSVIELLSLRTALPWLLIESLSNGACGLLVFSSQDRENSHYLESDRSLTETIKRSGELLKAAGIDPSRLAVTGGNWRDIGDEMREFAERLRSAGLSSLKPERLPLSADESPLMRALMGLEVIAGTDMAGGGGEDKIPVSSLRYLNMLNALLRAVGIPALEEMSSSVRDIVGSLDMGGGEATLFDVIERLSGQMDISPLRSVVSTQKTDDKRSSHFKDAGGMALIRCPGDEVFGGTMAAKLLESLGADVTEIDAVRSGREWLRLDLDSLMEAKGLLDLMEKKELRGLITVSPFGTAALRIMFKGDSWVKCGVVMRDVFTVLGEALAGSGDAV